MDVGTGGTGEDSAEEVTGTSPAPEPEPEPLSGGGDIVEVTVKVVPMKLDKPSAVPGDELARDINATVDGDTRSGKEPNGVEKRISPEPDPDSMSAVMAGV